MLMNKVSRICVAKYTSIQTLEDNNVLVDGIDKTCVYSYKIVDEVLRN